MDFTNKKSNMVDLRELLRKKGNNFNKAELGSSENISPAERELMSFRERERQDNIKIELSGFRKTNSMLNDRQGLHEPLLGQKATLFEKGKKQHSILDSKNVFGSRGKNLLTGGEGLW